MATYEKNVNRIVVNGGNDLQIKFGTSPAWESLGHIISGKINDKTDNIEVVFADGDGVDLDGKRKVTGEFVLAQTSKSEIELLDVLRTSSFPMYFYNGIKESKYQEFYFKEVKIIADMELAISGNELQKILFKFSGVPQTANVAPTPSTDLPTAAKSHATATPVTGKNKYYVVIETAVA